MNDNSLRNFIQPLIDKYPDLGRFDFTRRPPEYWLMPQEAIASSFLLDAQQQLIEVRMGRAEASVMAAMAGHPSMERPFADLSPSELGWLRTNGGAFGAGAFLPPLLDWEPEIARARTNHQVRNIVSFRARPSNGRTLYNVVDEYYDQGSRYQFDPRCSDQSLTLGEVTKMILTAAGVGSDGSTAALQIGDDLEFYRPRRVSSFYYPELETIFNSILRKR